MSLSYGDTARSLEHRRDFLLSRGIDYTNLVCAQQVHGKRVHYARAQERGRGALDYQQAIADTDAFITDCPGLPLAIFNADCLSVYLYDPTTPAIGLVHAGWKSTRSGIIAGALVGMRETFGSRIKDIYVGFGPSLRVCCYEVGEEFKDYFPQAVTSRDSRFSMDLVKANTLQAQEAGVAPGNIFDTHACTACQNQDFFSYRREGVHCGRMLSVMMLG